MTMIKTMTLIVWHTSKHSLLLLLLRYSKFDSNLWLSVYLYLSMLLACWFALYLSISIVCVVSLIARNEYLYSTTLHNCPR